MVSYNKSKKELTIKDVNDIKDLVKSLPKDILSIDASGSIKIQVPNIILEKDSSLTLDNGRYLIVTDKLICKENSSLILGSDEKDSIFTKIIFNIGYITTSETTNITFKNSIVESNNDWYIGNDTLENNGIVSLINTEMNFKIFTNNNLVIKNIKVNDFISTDRDVVVHDVNISNKFDKEYLLEPNGNIIFYNGILDNYNKILDTDLLTKNIRLVFKGTKLIGGYDFVKNPNLEIIHELLFAGKIYDNTGNLVCNKDIEIIDRFNNVVETITTDDNGSFSTWLSYYTYLNNTGKFHMPYYINNKGTKTSISIKENKSDMVLHISNNIDKDLLLLIERVDVKIENGFTEVKTGLANLMFNSEKPIKNVAPVSVKSEQGTRLTIN